MPVSHVTGIFLDTLVLKFTVTSLPHTDNVR